MDDLAITHEETARGGRYTARPKDSNHEGYLEWHEREEGVRVAAHTIVPPPIGGQGIAARLVERLVFDARRQGFRIDPQCSYVAAKFAENPDWADLRA